MIETKLLEKFIVSLVPDDARVPVQQGFKIFYKNPTHVGCGGIAQIQQHFFKECEGARVAAVNGLMLGFMLVQMMTIDEGVKVFEGYLEAQRRADGENVVNFQEFLINKRR